MQNTPAATPPIAPVPPASYQSPKKLSMPQVLICGALIVGMAMGVRHGFGLWLQPITQAQGWSRESFSFAIAIQNLSWGVFGIGAGMLADKIGAFKVLVIGAILYSLGLAGMAFSTSPLVFTLTAGVLIGLAQSATTYAVVYGVIGRQIAPEKRSWAMGVAAAAGSFGQFLLVPVESWMISAFGWKESMLILVFLMLAIIPAAIGLREPGFAQTSKVKRDQTIGQALREALKYRSFQLLLAGYFVCGFQLVFIGIHMPSYLKDKGLSPQVAGYALALIGLFNVFGSYAAGTLGQRFKKKYILSFIYFARAVAISLFVFLPLSPMSVYIFASAMGLLWLSTVPPTSAAVAQIFGVQHLSMLGGFIFCSHQIGSFIGVWLGGYMYDHFGNYDLVWYLCVALGVFAGLINLPVNEGPIRRAAPSPTQPATAGA